MYRFNITHKGYVSVKYFFCFCEIIVLNQKNIYFRPIEPSSYNYFVELATQIHASKKYFNDLLVAGDVVILGVRYILSLRMCVYLLSMLLIC